MLLKSISLDNIRSYNSEKMIFPEGSTLLSGDIGAGKSTILLAVEFALFGIGKGEISGESLLRNGKNDGAVELDFSVDGKDVKIKRTLKRQKDSVAQGTGSIEINGSKKEATAVELKSEILSLLGYPKEALTKKSLIYRYTVYTPQEEMKHILFDEKDHRLNTLRRVFNIDRYKRVAENSLIYVRKLKEDRKELKGEIFDIDEKEKLYANTMQLILTIQNDISKAESSAKDLKSRLERKKSEIKEHESKIKSFNDLRKDLELKKNDLRNKNEIIETKTKDKLDLKERIAELKEKLDEIDSIIAEQYGSQKKEIISGLKSAEEIDSTLETVQKILSEKEESVASRTNSYLTAKEKLDSSRKRMAELDAELGSKLGMLKGIDSKKSCVDALKQSIARKHDVKAAIDQAEKQLQDMMMHLQELQLNKNNSQKIKDTITKMNECPTCMQQVSATYKLNLIERERSMQEELKRKVGELNIAGKRISEELDGLKREHDIILANELELKKLETEMKSLEQLGKEAGEKTSILGSLKKAVAEYEKNASDAEAAAIESLKRDIEDSKSLLKFASELKLKTQQKDFISRSIEEKELKIKELNEEEMKLDEESELIKDGIASIVESIEEMGNPEESYLGIKAELDQLMKWDMDAQLKHSSLRKEIEVYESTNERLRKELEHKKESRKKLQSIDSMQAWIEDYFMKLMASIEKHMFSRVYHEFNNLFQEWFNVLVDDELMSIKLDYDFSPVVEQNGYTIDVEHLSGGEKTAVALAYRLALNKVINDIMSGIKTKDIIILDEPTDGFSTDQLDKIRHVLEQLNTKQTIIVSHESKIESFVSNIIRINKHEHISKAE